MHARCRDIARDALTTWDAVTERAMAVQVKADQMAAETAGEVEYTMPLAAVSFADVEVAAAGAEGAQPIKKATRSEASRRTDRSKRSSKSRRHREKHNGSWLQNTVLSPLLRAAKRYEKPLHELSAELKLAGENMRDTIGTQILRGLACSPRDSWAGLNGTPQTAAHPSHRSLLSPSKDTNSPSNWIAVRKFTTMSQMNHMSMKKLPQNQS